MRNQELRFERRFGRVVSLILLSTMLSGSIAAQQTFHMNNSTSCSYTISILYAATCGNKATAVNQTLGPNSSLNYTTPSGVIVNVYVKQGTTTLSTWNCTGGWTPQYINNGCGAFQIWVHGNGTSTNAIDYT